MKESLVVSRWSLAFFAGTALLLSTASVGATEAAISCQEAGALKGPIKDIVVTMGSYRHATGLPEGRVSVQQDLQFSDDRRAVTITTHERDVPGQRFPRTSCDYDSSGRLVRDILLLDGSNAFTLVEYEYEPGGRLTKSTSTSKNWEFNRTVSYAYGDGWHSERFVSAVASVLTLTTVDGTGRPVKVVKSDEGSGAIRSTVEYSYADADITVCATEIDGARWCATEKRDSHGNRTEYAMPAFNGLAASHTVERYEYDSFGNWVTHVTVSNSFRQSSEIGHAIWRKITYR